MNRSELRIGLVPAGDDAPAPELSVIVVAEDYPRIAALLETYRNGLDAVGRSYELICMVDDAAVETRARLAKLAESWRELIVFGQRPWAGEDAALAAALKRARADLVMTLPGWPEVDPADFGALFDALGDNHMAVGRRPEKDGGGGVLGLRKAALKRLLRALFGRSVSDVFCRARLTRREVFDEIGGFGVRQHFLPVLAAARGFRLVEAPMQLWTLDGEPARYVFKPLGHLRALFDALALYVVLNFLRRPLRFFGAIGLPVLVVGLLATSVLVANRLFGDMPLAERPALIFSVMMIVLGVQIIALGLVGEIVIFASSRRMKTYTVETVIGGEPGAAEAR